MDDAALPRSAAHRRGEGEEGLASGDGGVRLERQGETAEGEARTQQVKQACEMLGLAGSLGAAGGCRGT